MEQCECNTVKTAAIVKILIMSYVYRTGGFLVSFQFYDDNELALHSSNNTRLHLHVIFLLLCNSNSPVSTILATSHVLDQHKWRAS